MKIDLNINNFEDIDFNLWKSEVESQLGISFNDYKIKEEINLFPLYNYLNKEISIYKSNKTRLFDKSIENDYDESFYFSDFQKNGLDALNEISYILYNIFSNQLDGKNILIISSIDIDFYVNILKFRALRFLLNKIKDKFGIKFNFEILATISPINKSYLDVETNIIRETSELVSAFISGVDYVSVSPFSIDDNDFATRISENIVRIIENETYLPFIYDSMKGSYFIENGTLLFIQNAFNTLQKFENLTSDEVDELIEKTSKSNQDKKIENIKNRKIKMLGVNVYINENQKDIHKTNSNSLAKYFESFHLKRKSFKEKNSIEPEIFLVCFGKYSEIKPRLDFMTDFLNAGAFKCKISSIFESIEDAINTIDLVNSKHNIIIAPNELYNSILPEILISSKNLNPSVHISIAGALDEENKNRFYELGLKNIYSLKSNLFKELELLWRQFESDD